MFRYTLLLFIGCLFSNIMIAQFAWIDPPVPDVTQEVTIFVDVAQDPDCSNLNNTDGPLYVWTWEPAGPVAVDGNGAWDNSNEEMVMTHEGGTIWSITFIPTEFYGVDADQVYDIGISFLAKEKDGGAGGDCSDGGGEFKTSDIKLEISSPFVASRKVFSIPDLVEDSLYSRPDDVFTISYDNNIEEKPTMQNLSEVFIYPRVFGDDGNQYTVTSLSQVGNNPDLRMLTDGNGIFTFTTIPKDFFADALPDGVKPSVLQFQLISWPLCGADCAVDGEFLYPFKCE